MKPSTSGYSPEQVATGSLDDGKEVVILYVKEFREQLSRISESGRIGYFYSWSYLEETNSFVLYICWENKEEIAIVFPPNQHAILEGMRAPKELIVTGMPVKMLVEQAQQEEQEFFDLSGDVVYLSGVVFKEPPKPN